MERRGLPVHQYRTLYTIALGLDPLLIGYYRRTNDLQHSYLETDLRPVKPMMQLRNPGGLRLLRHKVEPNSDQPGVDVVIIPGVWDRHRPSDRNTATCAWVRPLEQAIKNEIRVFLFSFSLELDGSSLWHQLLGQGEAFLNSISEDRASSGNHRRPLLLICHSLGGLIAKRALTLQHPSRQAYEDVLSGIIFLGTPHIVSAAGEGWNNLKLLMRANQKEVSRNNMGPDEMESIIATCKQFEHLQLVIPILSVYETQETKFRGTFLSSFQRKGTVSEVLLPKHLVRVNSHRESLFEVDKPHFELYDMAEDDPLYNEIIHYFDVFARHGPRNVQLAFRHLHQLNDSTENAGQRTNMGCGSAIGSMAHMVDSKSTKDGNVINELNTPKITIPYPLSPDDAQTTLEELLPLPFSHLGSISRNDEFYGRLDILSQIDDAFSLGGNYNPESITENTKRERRNEPTAFVLSGMAGIGKTEIAVQYVFARRTYFDVVVWVYADTELKIQSQFMSLAREISQETVSETIDADSAREMVWTWLAKPTGRRLIRGENVKVDAKWLLVFDNADDPDILYNWLPESGPGCILITGKYPYYKTDTNRLRHGMEVEPLSSEDSAKMLRKFSGRDRGSDAIETSTRIADVLGGIPFAITHMSAIIRQTHLTFEDFENWYKEDSKGLHDLGVRGNQSKYPYTVGTVWAIEQLAPIARGLLKVLSVLDPDRIPEELFLYGAEDDIHLLDLPIKRFQYFKGRAELLNTSLVTRNMATNELHIHRLVQDVVRGKMTKEELCEVYAAAAALLSPLWPWVSGTDPSRNQTWRIPVAERLTPHICRLEALMSDALFNKSYRGTPKLGVLFSSYAWYIFERGNSEQSERFAKHALSILGGAEDSLPDDDDRVSHWLGEAYHCASLAGTLTGTTNGIPHVESWLGIIHKRIEKYNTSADRLSLSIAHNQMGICFAHEHRIIEAKASFEHSIDVLRDVEDRPQFSGTFPAVSLSVLYHLEGCPEEGEAVIAAALEEHERVLGRDDVSGTESGHLWHCMGKIRHDQNRHEEALDYYQLALANFKATVGEKHYFAGDCFYNIAIEQKQLGMVDESLANLDRAIDAFTSDSNREAQAARALWKKGCLLEENGKESESKTLFKQAMDLRRIVQPHDRRLLEELGDGDWTAPIFYWSR